MTSNNVFFEQNARKMYGQQFGYAIEYKVSHELGEYNVKFAEHLIMPEDPQHTKMPQPIDLVSECIKELLKEAKGKSDIIAEIYSRRVRFSSRDSTYDIKRRIREIQKSLIKISPEASNDVKAYLQTVIWESIRNMPVH